MWPIDNAGQLALEQCEGLWRPTVQALAAAPGLAGLVPTMAESFAGFVRERCAFEPPAGVVVGRMAL